MTDEQIVEEAKSAEKKTEFGKLVRSKVSRGVNSAYGIGFLEGAEWAREQMTMETPASDDLEKAAREYAMDDFYNGYSSGSIVEDTMKNFKAGAEWQKEQMMREKQHDEFSSNVEQESLNLNPYEHIVKCALDGVTRLGSLCDDKAIIDAAKLCVEKLNEQMMKGAVEGFIFQSEDYYPKELIANYNGELKHGDKVRIIIVKPE